MKSYEWEKSQLECDKIRLFLESIKVAKWLFLGNTNHSRIPFLKAKKKIHWKNKQSINQFNKAVSTRKSLSSITTSSTSEV